MNKLFCSVVLNDLFTLQRNEQYNGATVAAITLTRFQPTKEELEEAINICLVFNANTQCGARVVAYSATLQAEMNAIKQTDLFKICLN